ncbi:MAG: bifunctional adenosylcobinamide kinase/adenosylcobinamide-phosphate guanylyltransferase [Lachnospiraceae bacterium]|nr:bifunctional adenosylcobinamide kinase/adenosylcobinamide-phosphate guanylyltransferase [Lachnospiraceae bacterium]MBQ9609492.1 bifunctional adenosylcobinamide kinase/adenosylcobinamide-phosphate guanylyltransferase [Lachnospiraceae bacterium]
MMILVYGGSGSGKSAFAEQRITELNDSGVPLYYLATMQVYGDEDRERVRRHRMLRNDKGFITIEQPRDIGFVVDRLGKGDVLLECMSNLVANEMFRTEDAVEGLGEELDDNDKHYMDDKLIFYKSLVTKIKNDIAAINKSCDNLVVVSNNVFEDGIKYDKSTMEYIKALGDINRYLAIISDEVWEVVAGIPIRVK